MFKRIICCLLALLMLVSVVACGSDEDPNPGNQNQNQGGDDLWGGDDPWGDDEEDLTDSEDAGNNGGNQGGGIVGGHETDAVGRPLEEDEKLEVAVTNFGGTEIKILQKDTSEKEMYAEREKGELINDAVYQRNKYVENYLGVKLKYESAPASVSAYDQFESRVKTAVSSGYDMYHIISNYTYHASTLIQEGAFLDVNGISADQNKIDLDKRWWNQSFHKESMINDKIYLLAGDITTTAIDWAEVLFVNNELLDDYLDMTSDELLEMVYEMDFTYETFLDFVHEFGNGKETGTYGFTGMRNSYSIDGMIMGMAMDLTYRDSKGYPNLSINTKKNADIGERLRELFQTDKAAECEGSMISTFSGGNSLFMCYLLEEAGKSLRSTTIDYMVIPVPLYDEFQEEYRIVPQDNVSSLSILVHVTTNINAVTTTLEVMGSESYINLRHCIQEKCYKQRYLRTAPKGKMFDYIVDNIYYDFGYTYSKVLAHPIQTIRAYARYLSGEGGYIASLPSQLEVVEVDGINKLQLYLEQFFGD